MARASIDELKNFYVDQSTHIGIIWRTCMAFYGISHGHIANKAGINKSTISLVLSCKRIPKTKTIEKVEAALREMIAGKANATR